MPLKCCVTGCNSNFESTKKRQDPSTPTSNYISVFKFPKDPHLFNEWFKAIPRDSWTPTSNSAVCIKHFHPEDVETTTVKLNEHGIRVTVPKSKATYKAGAVPKIFDGCPAYLSQKPGIARADPEARKATFIEKENAAQEEWMKGDVILGIAQFLEGVDKFHKEFKQKWALIRCEKKVVFYILNHKCEIPSIAASVTVHDTLFTQVCVENYLLTSKETSWILNGCSILERWSQLENILNRYALPTVNIFEDSPDLIKELVERIQKLVQDDTFDSFLQSKIMFLLEQINLAFAVKKSYSRDMILSSFMLYEHSSSAYNVMRQNILTLPHPKYLEQLTRKFEISPNSKVENDHFLKTIADRLTDKEKFIILQLDEIYVKPQLQYITGTIRGAATNNSSVARTVQTFMISSAFGRMKEVMALHPVKDLTGQELAELTRSAILLLQQLSLTVMVVISDNNRLNQNMFSEIDNFLKSHNIQFMYDPVHIFKNIRNNLLNKKDFLIPEFEDYLEPLAIEEGEILLEVQYSDIISLYRKEAGQLLKTAPKLSYNCCFPSNLDRQKVSLAVRMFHETTITGLKMNNASNGTLLFLSIFREWWTIMNVKNPVQGIRSRNDLSFPFSSVEDARLNFLDVFIRWLQRWHQISIFGNFNFLTADTYHAIIKSTRTVIDLIKSSLVNIQVSYVLPGKFQTDNLEGRFSSYRQLSGGNYNVSVQQVLEAEKKIRMKSLLGTKSAKYRRIDFRIDSIDELFPSVSGKKDHLSELDYFIGILDSYEENDVQVDESALLVVSGYAAFKVANRLDCQLCIEYVSAPDTNDKYFNDLSRGGLTVPSKETLIIGQHAHTILFLLQSEPYKTAFLQTSHQDKVHLSLLKKVIMCDENFCGGNVCICKKTHLNLIEMLLPHFSNTLLSNYVKECNDTVTSGHGNKRKLSTLQK